MKRYVTHRTLRLLPEQLERIDAAVKLSESPWKGRSYFMRQAVLAAADKLLGSAWPLVKGGPAAQRGRLHPDAQKVKDELARKPKPKRGRAA